MRQGLAAGRPARKPGCRPSANDAGPRPDSRPAPRPRRPRCAWRLGPGQRRGPGAARPTASSTTRDRALVTELVYGTCRMRRACDWLVDRHTRGRLDTEVRCRPPAGRLPAGLDPDPAPRRGVGDRGGGSTARGVGRQRRPAPGGRRARSRSGRLARPGHGAELPRLDRGPAGPRPGPQAARDALLTMNEPAAMTVRADGYVQDRASQMVAAHVGARARRTGSSICAPPPEARPPPWPAERSRPWWWPPTYRPTGPRVVAANVARLGAPCGRHRGRRRPAPAVARRPASTGSWSTRPARGWASSAAAPTPAGGSSPATWRGWPGSSAACWPRPAAGPPGRGARLQRLHPDRARRPRPSTAGWPATAPDLSPLPPPGRRGSRPAGAHCCCRRPRAPTACTC